MKENKGFTLIELLAVIVILAIIALIATPIILNVIEESRENANKDSVAGIVKAADLYYSQHVFDGTIPFETNILDTLKLSGGKPDSGYVFLNKDGNVEVGVVYGKMCLTKGYSDADISVSDDIENCKYVVKPNAPVLNNGLVGITITDDGTVAKANTSNSDWYNYDEKKWANAVVLADKNGSVTKDNILAYYVWIPRYEYKTGFESGEGNEETIEVNFIGKDVTTATDEHIIPPGFTFGAANLSGIWVAKYEPSYSDTSVDGTGFTCDTETCAPAANVRIIPGVTSLRSISVSESFYISRSLENSYGLEGNSHMMKNSEWATVAYLSHSKYGKNSEVTINSNSSYITGGGTENAYVSNQSQSTTGNVSGIYDMSGGAYEYMMASYGTDENTASIGSSGFSILPDNKYYDIMYNADTLLGHAMEETRNWYGDYSYFVSSSYPWVGRGGLCGNGSSAGLWYFNDDYGYGNGNSSSTFRPAFVPTD